MKSLKNLSFIFSFAVALSYLLAGFIPRAKAEGAIEQQDKCEQVSCGIKFSREQKIVLKSKTKICANMIESCKKYAAKKIESKCLLDSDEFQAQFYIFNQEKHNFKLTYSCKSKAWEEKNLISEQSPLGTDPKTLVSVKNENITKREPSSQDKGICQEKPWICEENDCGNYQEKVQNQCRCLPGFKAKKIKSKLHCSID